MSTIKSVYSIKKHDNSLKIVIHNRRHWPTIVWAIVCIATAIPLALIVLLALSANPGGVAILLGRAKKINRPDFGAGAGTSF